MQLKSGRKAGNNWKISGQCTCRVLMFLMYSLAIHSWHIKANNAKGIKHVSSDEG